MNDLAQHYQTLGISPAASPEEIKQAYRRLAKTWHPDFFVDDPVLREKAELEIKKINQAYTVIKNNLDSKTKQNLSSNYTEVVEKKNTPEYHYNQGVALASAENFTEAITEFSLAIRLQPNYLEAYQYRSYVLSKLGYEHRANSDMRKVAQLKITNRAEDLNTNRNSTKIKSNSLLRTFMEHNKPVYCVAISPDGKFLATGSQDKTIKLWDLQKLQAIGSLKGHRGTVNCLAWMDSNRVLISGGQDRKIKFWDLALRTNTLTFGSKQQGHSASVNSLAIDRSRHNLISSADDNLIKIWSLKKSKLIDTIKASQATITCLDITQDNQFFCSGSLEKQLRIRITENNKIFRSLRGECGVLALSFSPDGNLLATGGLDCKIKIWDITSGQEIYTLGGHKDRISSLIFSLDGKFLISGSWDTTVKFWKLNIGQEVNSLPGHSDRILSLAIAPDNRTIITGSADCSIKIWQTNF